MSALFLPALLQAAPVAIVILDLAGRVLDVNCALLDASGYTVEDLRGVRFDAFIEPATAEASRARFAALVTGQCEGYRAAARYRTRGGELRDVDVRVTLVRSAEGVPEFCLAVLQDVTEHVHALDALRCRAAELESVIESIPAAVYIGDETGIKMANDAALAQLGYTDVAELNRHIAELSAQLHNRDASGQPIPWQDEPFARALRGEAVDTEVVSRHQQTGEDVVQRVIAAPVRVENRVVGAVAVNTNITARRRTEEALRVSEQRYRALVEQAPFSVQILSPDGRTLQVNRSWEQLWGLTLEQLGGYNMLEDAQLEARGLMPFIRRGFEGQPARIPESVYDVDETLPDASSREDARRWVRAVIYPLKDDSGRVREVVLIHEDITGQVDADRRSREATELLQLVIEQSGEAIVVADERGVLRVFNAAAERLYGVSRDATPPEQWTRRYRLLRPDGTPLPFEETALHRAVQGQFVRDHRWMVWFDDGTTRWLVGTATPLRKADGSPAGAVLIARDETDRVAAEAERDKLLADVQRAHRELQGASRLKDEFLAMLSHELRTPLNAVLGWARILSTRPMDPQSAHAVDVIKRNAAAQARLIDDLLDVSRIITGKIVLRIAPVDLRAVAAAALETVRPAAESRGVTLDLHAPEHLPPASGDAERLQQITLNLLSNAVKFNQPGGRVQIRFDAPPQAVRMVVSDTGIGIPAAILPLIFDRFTQADSSSTRAHSGLGLGLAIVRHLVDLHGGTITAESPGPGAGATFTVTLSRG